MKIGCGSSRGPSDPARAGLDCFTFHEGTTAQGVLAGFRQIHSPVLAMPRLWTLCGARQAAINSGDVMAQNKLPSIQVMRWHRATCLRSANPRASARVP